METQAENISEPMSDEAIRAEIQRIRAAAEASPPESADADAEARRQAVKERLEGTKERVFDLEIARLAALSVLDYERERKTMAKGLGIRPAILDTLVEAKRQEAAEAAQLPFPKVEPWPHPVSGPELLDEIEATIGRFIVCTPHVRRAAALWAAFTWFIDVVQVAPIALITAPEKGCGKTQLLAILARLSARPLSGSGISPAALFRAVEQWRPTLFIDEADTFMRDNEELRGVINSGHTRDTAFIIRTVGEEHTPRRFGTWGAKAIAGIKVERLALTITDRSIVLSLRKRLKTEKVERLRKADPALFPALASKLARFAQDAAEIVERAEVPDLEALSDRQMDNWEPLLAVALAAGGHWPERATEAALALSGVEEEPSGPGPELLANIRAVFQEQADSPFALSDRIATADLIKALCENEEWRWATYNHGREVSARQVAAILKGYGIKTKTNIRIGEKVVRGYMKADFEDAFSRYLTTEKKDTPPISPVLSATGLQPNNFNEISQNLSATSSNHVADKNWHNHLNLQECSTVAHKKPQKGGEEKKPGDSPPMRIGPDGIAEMTF